MGVGLVGLDDAGFAGEDDGLDSVAELEVVEEASDVTLDGRGREEETRGNLGVRETAGEQYEGFRVRVR